jgi:rhodanese-related sulfurtransferase
MSNIYGAPEISVQELADKLSDRRTDPTSQPFILLDVRELHELPRANFGDEAVVVPLTELAARQTGAMPDPVRAKDAEILVVCHHGVRSAQVTAWMLQQGWTNVLSVAGGIDAYARQVDPAVGMY